MAGTVALRALRSTYYALLTTTIVKIVNGKFDLVYDYMKEDQKCLPFDMRTQNGGMLLQIGRKQCKQLKPKSKKLNLLNCN